jgi:hypothetical protein
MRRFLVIAALLVQAAPAYAADLPPRADAVLDQGRPYVEVHPDPDGVSGVVLAAIDIAASQSAVWAVIGDCDLATRMVTSLKSCRIVDRDPQGRWDVREQISRMTFLPSVRSVFRSDYEPPGLIRFHRVSGDLPVFEGEWRIEPRGGEVRVIYEARAAAPFSVPGWAARIALRHDVPQALLALRREVLARTP